MRAEIVETAIQQPFDYQPFKEKKDTFIPVIPVIPINFKAHLSPLLYIYYIYN